MRFAARVSCAIVGAALSVGCQSTTSPPPASDAQLRAVIEQASELAAQRKFPEALEAIDRAVVLAPGNIEAHRLRVHCLAGSDAFDELLAECDLTLTLGPPDAWLVYERGVALKEIGRYREAIDGFDRALELDARHCKSLQHRGWTHQLIHEHEAAIADFTRALELSPSAADRRLVLGLRADSFEALGRHEGARSDRRDAEAIAPAP